MSLADLPDIGPVAQAVLDALKANMKPGESPEDAALICCAVAASLLVESAALSGKPESIQYRLERAQALLESMVDFNVALNEGDRPLRAAARKAVVTKMRHVSGEACIISFPGRRAPRMDGGGDVA